MAAGGGISQEEILFIMRMRDEASKVLKSYGDTLGDTGDKAQVAETEVKSFAEAAKVAAQTVAAAWASMTIAKSTLTVFSEFDDKLYDLSQNTHLTGEGLADLQKGLDDLANHSVLPARALEDIAITAGQVGVKGKEHILSFTDTMSKLVAVSDLTAEQAAFNMKRINDLTGEGEQGFAKMANILAVLADGYATSEAQILASAQSVGQSTAAFKLSSDTLAAYGLTFSQMGVSAETGGMALGKTLRSLAVAADNGGDAMKQITAVTGMTQEAFKKLVDSNPTKAMDVFLESLQPVLSDSGRLNNLMKDLKLNGMGLQDVIIPLAQHFQDLTEAQKMAAVAGQELTGLEDDYAQFSQLFSSQFTEMSNTLVILAKNIGQALSPIVITAMQAISAAVRGLSEAFSALPGFVQTIAAGFIVLTPALWAAQGALAFFGVSLTALLGPIGLVVAAIALIGGGIYAFSDHAKSMDEAFAGATSAATQLSAVNTQLQTDYATLVTAQETLAEAMRTGDEAQKTSAQIAVEAINEKIRGNELLRKELEITKREEVRAAEAALAAEKKAFEESGAMEMARALREFKFEQMSPEEQQTYTDNYDPLTDTDQKDDLARVRSDLKGLVSEYVNFIALVQKQRPDMDVSELLGLVETAQGLQETEERVGGLRASLDALSAPAQLVNTIMGDTADVVATGNRSLMEQYRIMGDSMNVSRLQTVEAGKLAQKLQDQIALKRAIAVYGEDSVQVEQLRAVAAAAATRAQIEGLSVSKEQKAALIEAMNAAYGIVTAQHNVTDAIYASAAAAAQLAHNLGVSAAGAEAAAGKQLLIINAQIEAVQKGQDDLVAGKQAALDLEERSMSVALQATGISASIADSTANASTRLRRQQIEEEARLAEIRKNSGSKGGSAGSSGGSSDSGLDLKTMEERFRAIEKQTQEYQIQGEAVANATRLMQEYNLTQEDANGLAVQLAEAEAIGASAEQVATLTSKYMDLIAAKDAAIAEGNTFGAQFSIQMKELIRGVTDASRLGADIVNSLGSMTGNFLSRMTKDGESFFSSLKGVAADTLGDIGRMLMDYALKVLIFKNLLGMGKGSFGGVLDSFLPSAKGNAFVPEGAVTLFAKGESFANEVYNTPTPFTYGKGKQGVMGEAGPEAVVPLKRGSDGSLGVSVTGGSDDTASQNILDGFKTTSFEMQRTLRAMTENLVAITTRLSNLSGKAVSGAPKDAKPEAQKPVTGPSVPKVFEPPKPKAEIAWPKASDLPKGRWAVEWPKMPDLKAMRMGETPVPANKEGAVSSRVPTDKSGAVGDLMSMFKTISRDIHTSMDTMSDNLVAITRRMSDDKANGLDAATQRHSTERLSSYGDTAKQAAPMGRQPLPTMVFKTDVQVTAPAASQGASPTGTDQKAVGKAIETAVKTTVLTTVMDMMRPGGLLYTRQN